MSSQQTLAGLGHSNDNKKFRYTLSSSDYGTETMDLVPKGWQEGELTFIRDPKYKGVIESYSTSSFEFVSKARDYIQTAYEAKGIDYNINIYIDILVNSTFKYKRYFTGKLDLSTYSIDSIAVKCEVIPTGFQNVVLNRAGIDVDLLNTKFIGGGEGSMEQITAMPGTFNTPSYTAQANADWLLNDSKNNKTNYVHYVPMVVNDTEFSSGVAQNQTFDGTTKFFVSDDTRTVDITGTIVGNLVNNSVSPQGLRIVITLYKNETPYQTYDSGEFPTEFNLPFSFPVSESIAVIATDSISFRAVATGVDINVSYLDSQITVGESLGTPLPGLTIDGFPIYEFTTRVLQLISGEVIPLYSDLLGRTDSAPDTYASDGDGSLMVMTKGLWIREFPITEGSTILQTINGSLDGVFKTLNGLLNIGMGFEVRSGVNKVVLEKEAYFFDITENPDYPATDSRPYLVNQILDVSSSVTGEILSKDVLPDWYANEISSGYSDFEYENIQGLKEFNTKSNYATPIASVKNKLDLVADYRYDTQGMNKLREKPYATNATEDVNGDNDIFGFDVKRLDGFTVKTDEDFTLVTGGVDPSQSYNLNYTPRLNFERHGNRIRSMRLALGDEIQWMKSEKNTKLITQKSGEDQKQENGDIVVQDLTDGYWIPEAYTFEAPVSEAVITALQANPRGVIKISDTQYGWILEVQTNNESNKGQFKLLRVDLDNVKVVI